jgi:AbrB family transcriptional regulator, stage V sporulation protein T
VTLPISNKGIISEVLEFCITSDEREDVSYERTLRIREGDPLEIFVDRDGEVILKKYSPIGELGDFAQEYAESLYENIQYATVICDRDSVIAVAGASKREYLEKPIGDTVEACMEQRRTHLESNPLTVELFKGLTEEYQSYVVVPINAGGDPIGAVIIFTKKEGERLGELEVKLASTAASFLGKQMEQ